MTFRSDFHRLVVGVFGAINAGAGGFFLFLEMQKESPSSGRVYFFAGWAIVGLLIMAPTIMLGAFRLFLDVLKQLIAILPFKTNGSSSNTKPPADPGAI